MGDRIEFYLDAESLLDLFAAYESAKEDRIRQVIAEGEQNCREALKQIEELLAKMPGEPEAREEKNVTEAQSGAEDRLRPIAAISSGFSIRAMTFLHRTLGKTMEKLKTLRRDVLSKLGDEVPSRRQTWEACPWNIPPSHLLRW